MTCENGQPFHDGTGDDFGCKVKGITFNPYAMPSRLHPSNPPRQPDPAWERGIARDQRNMPYLNAQGDAVGLKYVADHRSEIEQHRRKLANSTPKEP